METSRFFGGPEGAIPQYNQTHDAEVYRLMFSYGVFSDIENELAVTETDPLSLNVKVDTGWAFVHGFWYHNDSALTKSLGASDPTYSRIDRIILRLDSTTSFKISCEVKEGTPAASPSPPDLTQTDAIYEISLAKVTVGAGVTSISNANITDERSFAEDKGLVNVVKLTGDQTIAGIKTFSDGIKTDTVDEETSGAGVTIDGLLIKDGTPANWDGWTSANETWTYVSANSFKISGDKTNKYSIGMKIKLTQTTVKYFYIAAISYSAPDTTITVNGAGLYTLAEVAITNPYYSCMDMPYGFPIKMIPGYVKARVRLNDHMENILDNTLTKVLLNTEEFDVGDDFADYKFVVPITGYYQINAKIYYSEVNVVAQKLFQCRIYKNGSELDYNTVYSVVNNRFVSPCISMQVKLVKDDYIELYALHTNGTNNITVESGLLRTVFDIFLVSII